ncbi:hypothetical protein HWV62_2731 [Athelia sp. TMB]|nr:hypothetical protein HWV62_2731 [Athelia sp. TMB]
MPPESAQPGSPALSAAEPIALPRLMATARSRSSSLPGLHRRYTAPTPSPLAPRPASFGFEQQPSPRFYPAATPPAPAYPDSFGEPQCQFLDPPPAPAPIRLSSINLYAEGMPPFTFSLDSVLARAPRDQPAPRLLIQIRVRLPSIDDVHACPTLHGVLGAATFTRAWARERAPSVVTDVYAGGVHTSRESGALLPAGAGACAAGTLPESELTRCRWLDSSKETSVYQRIIADGETMAVVVYSLDRSPNHDQLPFAEVVAVQKYRVNEKPAAQACSQYPAPAATPAPYYSEPQASAPRYPAQTSLSCALTAPAYTHAAPTSMLL